MKITKRNGNVVEFNKNKIADAIKKANLSVPEDTRLSDLQIERITERVSLRCEIHTGMVGVEDIQDMVEIALMEFDAYEVARNYILYRNEHAKARNRRLEIMNSLSGKFEDITNNGGASAVTKGSSGNANVDSNGPMGKMLQYGSEFSKALAMETMLSPAFAEAHKNGDIHIHDLDFLPTKTLTCCQIDLEKLFSRGFSTGHGFLREPQSIGSYAALAAIALQANQNEQHGGQSVPAFDFYLAPGVKKTFHKELKNHLKTVLEDIFDIEPEKVEEVLGEDFSECELTLEPNGDCPEAKQLVSTFCAAIPNLDVKLVEKAVKAAYKRAYAATDKATYQAMEGFVHNLNTMHSRAGAQVPFTSVNYGTDTSPEGRMVIRNLLLATDAGLGNGETPIFPIQIFKIKDGISFEGDPNGDLYDLACRVSAKRLFPNFSFIDSPFNLQYYVPGRPETEVAYMGCRTRVIGNACGEEVVAGRGNLSFTSINMPRLAIKASKSVESSSGRIAIFYALLDEKLELVKNQLLERMAIQKTATVKNFSFLMGQGVWKGSENLNPNDLLSDVINQGTISIGFIGLAETLTALTGKHHGESEDAQKLGLEIVTHMRAFCDAATKELGLNVTLLATPAEGLSGRFTRMDAREYGIIEGVTDKDYYTNSFHVPVKYPCTAFEKISLEAPYHALTNAGHISYIELDSDPLQNIDAFKAIVKAEKEAGMGYAAINHPVDRDPICGYTGIIGNTCPKCGRNEDDGGIQFERIRRITGYLVGGMDRWNSAKVAEERDRIGHSVTKEE